MHVFPYVEMSIGFLNLKNRVEIYICMYIILLPAFPLGWSRQLVRVSVVLVGQEGGGRGSYVYGGGPTGRSWVRERDEGKSTQDCRQTTRGEEERRSR